MTESSAPSGLARWVPIVGWLPHYDRSGIRVDLVAGFTIWGLLIPEMIAYAGLAGLPPQAGLYTLLASLGLYAIFGTSRQLVVAGTSASAVLVYSAATDLVATSTSSYAVLAAAMIVLTGVFFLVSGLARLGFISEFLSRPVMAGFVFGLAIYVLVGQLPKIFGLEKGEGNTFQQLWYLIEHLDETSVTTLIVGIVALALLFGIERWFPKLPGGLVVLVLGISLSALLDLSSHGVAIVGDIPTGLPSVAFPHIALDDLWVLVPSAVGMMLVIYSEALGAGKNFAEKHGYRLDSDQEMLALGLANIGSGLLGGLAAGGSLSQTAVNDGAGARSEMSPIVAAGLSLVTVIALTPLFTDLPEAVLGALVIHAVSHLMKVAEMREFYRVNRSEFWLGVITLLGVLTFDVLPGLMIGLALSLVLLIARASRPNVSLLGVSAENPDSFEDVERHAEAAPIEGVLIVRPDAALFYANAQGVRDAIDDAVKDADPPVHTVVLDLDANDDLDITTADHLAKLEAALARSGVQLCISHLHTPTQRVAELTGVLDAVGVEHVFPDNQAAVQWATGDSRDQDG